MINVSWTMGDALAPPTATSPVRPQVNIDNIRKAKPGIAFHVRKWPISINHCSSKETCLPPDFPGAVSSADATGLHFA